jgi:hypothetical protein
MSNEFHIGRTALDLIGGFSLLGHPDREDEKDLGADVDDNCRVSVNALR